MPFFARGTHNDDSLLHAVCAGDAEAVSTWYDREHPQVYRLAVGFLAQREEAEDTAQDAMLLLLDRLPAWTRDKSYRAWRNTVVANLCRDRIRQRATRERHEQNRDLPQPAPGPSPEERIVRSELQAQLMCVLQRLTDREREVFVLRDLEQCSTSETAQVLAISEGTVRSFLSLARRRLRRLLRQGKSGEDS